MRTILITAALLLGTTFCHAKVKKVTITPETLKLTTQVNSSSISPLIRQILRSDKEIMLMYINSPGGSVYQGLKLIEIMKASNKKFVCIADFAASMAFSIFQNCTTRLILPYSILMQHQSSWGVSGTDGTNKAIIKLFNALNASLEKHATKKLRMSVKTYRELVVNDLWLFGDVALRYSGYKFADKVVNIQCSKACLNTNECPIAGEVTNTSSKGLDADMIKEINTFL